MWLRINLGRPWLHFPCLPLHHGGAAVAAIAAPSIMCSCQRGLHLSSNTSSGLAKKQNFFDRFIEPRDLNKRPSDLEIKKKDLPKNQATLGERLGRWTCLM
jgi:hypothetical protein